MFVGFFFAVSLSSMSKFVTPRIGWYYHFTLFLNHLFWNHRNSKFFVCANFRHLSQNDTNAFDEFMQLTHFLSTLRIDLFGAIWLELGVCFFSFFFVTQTRKRKQFTWIFHFGSFYTQCVYVSLFSIMYGERSA